jgi:hypothetical protein
MPPQHHHDGHGHRPRPFPVWDWPQPQYTYVVDQSADDDETPKWAYVLAGVLLGLLIRGN